MQRGVGNGYATHKHGRKLGHRRELAGAAHLHVNGLHGGDLLLRRIFVRHGPARFAADKAQLLLQGKAVDLVDHAIDIKRQAVAQRGYFFVKCHQPLRSARHFAMRRYGQPHGLERIQHVALRLGRVRPVQHLAFAIGKKAQWALPGYGRVKLAQSACCGIAGVDKGFFVLFALRDFLALLLVQLFEIVAPHIDFAAHFQHVRGLGGAQLQGDLPDGADVLRHVLTRFAIAARGGLHQRAVFVTQAHGQAVEFQLRLV